MGEAVIAGIFLVIATTITGFFAWLNARRARASAARVEEQIVPSNGTKLHEYIERNDKRLEHLIELVIETRDAAAEAALKASEAATSTDLHEAVYRHEMKE